jgi:MIP family channel proteins
MYNLSQRASAEFIGTFALILIGAGSVLTNSYSANGITLVGIALAHGLTIMVMVYAFGKVSGGHFNPAVTFAMWLTKRLPGKIAAVYILVQLVGATIAAFVLAYLLPLQATLLHAGTPTLGSTLSISQGLVIETLITFILVLVIFAVAIDPDNDTAGHAGLPIGLTIALLILFAGPLTGAAINPARAIGPALASSYVTNLSIYIIGPLIGASLAALLYQKLFLKFKA